MNDPTTFHSSTAVSVYDSLGNAQTLQMFYVKRPTGSTGMCMPPTMARRSAQAPLPP